MVKPGGVRRVRTKEVLVGGRSLKCVGLGGSLPSFEISFHNGVDYNGSIWKPNPNDREGFDMMKSNDSVVNLPTLHATMPHQTSLVCTTIHIWINFRHSLISSIF